MPMPRKPTALKILQGNPSQHALNKNEPVYETANLEPPSFLYGVGLEEWNDKAPLLAAKGVLTQADRAALSNYCVAYQELVEMTEKIKADGYFDTTSNGNVIQHAAVSIRHQAMDKVNKFLTEFGMTPASRTKISVDNPGSNSDPFEKLIR